MKVLKQIETKPRDYSPISPSAKSLLYLKGLTSIPFAREVAGLIAYPEKYNPDMENKDMAFWKRVVHFENRHWSIDQLLSALPIKNILELSSGFSFRGLEFIKHNDVHYIDTDLPELINTKKEFLRDLVHGYSHTKGTLELMPLNALDEENFMQITENFGAGPIAIVNEGLLMYLDEKEKEKLCKIIHKILSVHGGYWITADVYVKSTLERLDENSDDNLKDLTDQQRIEDNMFESFLSAEAFFRKAGFVLVREAVNDLEKISSLKYMINNASEEQIKGFNAGRKIQATWCLKVAD
jgi:O-methyltransferase involved in polyketide biosynthesis